MLQALVTSKWGIEQEYVGAVMSIPRATEYPLLTAIDPAHRTSDEFMEHRESIIEGMSVITGADSFADIQ